LTSFAEKTTWCAVPSKAGVMTACALGGKLTMQIGVTILHACTGTAILSEALSSEIKLS